MSNPITNYGTVTNVTSADLFWDWQSGAQQSCTAAQLKTFLLGGGSIAVASGKTLTSSNTVTFTATDGSTVVLGAGGTVLYASGIGSTVQAYSARLAAVAALSSPGASGFILSATTSGTLSWIPQSLTATASGTNTYTATPSPALSSYVAGQLVYIKFTNANTAGSSLNLNGIGAAAIQLAGSAITAGQIPAGAVVALLYDGTNFQIISGGPIPLSTTQNISTLSNLTANGFVKTGGGTGALTVDTTSYQVANAALTTLAAAVGTTGYVWTITGTGTAAYVALASYTLPAATTTTLGGVIVPGSEGLALDGSGNLTLIDGQLPGTETNDSATSGNIGEYISSTVASGSAVSLTSGMTSNVTSISLTAGDWDVTGVVDFHEGSSTVSTYFQEGTSVTSATLGPQDSYASDSVAMTTTVDVAKCVPTMRYSLASTTTIYLVAKAGFSISTLTAYGTLRARRVR